MDIQEKSVELYDCLLETNKHVAGFWIGANEVVWYLDIADKITKNNKVRIIHLKRTVKMDTTDMCQIKLRFGR